MNKPGCAVHFDHYSLCTASSSIVLISSSTLVCILLQEEFLPGEGLLIIGMNCPEGWRSHHPWSCSWNDWMWHSVPSMVELAGWWSVRGWSQWSRGVFFQHKWFCNSYGVNKTAVVIGKLRLAEEWSLEELDLRKYKLRKIVQGLCKYVYVFKHPREGSLEDEQIWAD